MTNAFRSFLDGQDARRETEQRNALIQQQRDAFRQQRGAQNTAGKVQNALMSGDREGARSMAMASGNADVMAGFRDQIGAMDEQQRQAAQRNLQGTAALGMAMRRIPAEQRQAWVMQNAPQISGFGLDPQQIAGMDLSNQNIDAYVSLARNMDRDMFADSTAPTTLAENEVRLDHTGAQTLNPNAAENRAIEQQNANSRAISADAASMNARTSAAREQREASQPQGQEWRTLTAAEAAAQGFNDGDVVQVNARTGQMARRSQDRPERTFNQQQALAAEFANRMIAANQAVDRVAGEGFEGNEMTRGDIPVVGGVLRGSRERRYDQAVDDFITAVLRRESGAAISAAEFDTAYRQYFPTFGDDPATIEQKRQLRERAIQNMQAGSQGAFEAMFGDARQQAQGAELGEGATATNPETGQRMIYRNGQWEPM